MAIPLQAPTVEVQRGEYGAVEVESVLTVGLSNRRMTVECVAFNLVGVSSDTFTMEVSGECPPTAMMNFPVQAHRPHRSQPDQIYDGS